MRSGRTTVAWMGQCVAESGDATDSAIATVGAQETDDSALAGLNGAFASAVIDSETGRVRVLTDRYRHYPVYVYRGSGWAIAATEMRCVLAFIPAPRLRQDSVNMFVRCGELIDRMTMVEGVELLPPATVLEWSGGASSERRYWIMRHGERLGKSIDETAEIIGERLTAATRRIEKASGRLGITLSGGLDSRMILDLCEHADRVPSYTWGVEGCRDIECAAAFARVVGSPHTVRHWDPAVFPRLWGAGVDVTAGSFSVEGMFMLPFVGLIGERCDVILNGLAGDAILGGNFLKIQWLREMDLRAMGRSSWRWRVAEWEDTLVDRLVAGRVGGERAGDQWAESIASGPGDQRPVERLNDWLYENRVFRNTNSGTMLLRIGVESHAPFFDRDVLDAMVSVRQEHKLKHRLYLKVMNRFAKRAASVKWQRTNVPPSWGFGANVGSMAMHRVIGKAGRLFGLSPFKSLAVADVPGWMRGPWREAIEGILLSERAMSRGIFSPEVVREVWTAHLAGAGRARQIGTLVATELFARQAIDGEEPAGMSG